VLYYILFGLAKKGEHLFAILVLLLFCGPIVPRTRSYLSKAVKCVEQTELFVAIAALEALGAALGPTLTFGLVRRCDVL
jgi:MFS-type transporter involved in bile tolerance (Atg22 family)